MSIKRRRARAQRAGAQQERWGFDSGVHKSHQIRPPKDPNKNPFLVKSPKKLDEKTKEDDPSETDD